MSTWALENPVTMSIYDIMVKMLNKQHITKYKASIDGMKKLGSYNYSSMQCIMKV